MRLQSLQKVTPDHKDLLVVEPQAEKKKPRIIITCKCHMNRHSGIDCYMPTSLLYKETDTLQSSTPWFLASSCREDVRNATV